MSKVDIVVLEDDPDLCVLLETMLTYAGYTVHAIQRADNVFDVLDKSNPDLLLMDMWLSGTDGKDICRQVKNDNAYQLQILMISAHPNAATDCLAAGADQFIAKPFEMKEFLSSVKTLLQSKSVI